VSGAAGTVRVRLFAAAREAVGTTELVAEPQPLGALLAGLRRDHGRELSIVLDSARVWVNGDEPRDGDATVLVPGDEVAVLPPVSGGTLAR
jgi:molybdopterin converting factor small subunit